MFPNKEGPLGGVGLDSSRMRPVGGSWERDRGGHERGREGRSLLKVGETERNSDRHLRVRSLIVPSPVPSIPFGSLGYFSEVSPRKQERTRSLTVSGLRVPSPPQCSPILSVRSGRYRGPGPGTPTLPSSRVRVGSGGPRSGGSVPD